MNISTKSDINDDIILQEIKKIQYFFINLPVAIELGNVVEIVASPGTLFDVDVFIDASAELVSP